VKDRCKIAKET